MSIELFRLVYCSRNVISDQQGVPGAEIAGILGALIAIPVAGSIQIVIVELIQRRNERRRAAVMG